MPGQLESVFQRKVMKKLKSHPHIWCYKASDRLKSGIPDIIACVSGHFVALELKRDEKSKPTPLQFHTLSEIIKANGVGIVVTPENWDEVWLMLIEKAGTLG